MHNLCIDCSNFPYQIHTDLSHYLYKSFKKTIFGSETCPALYEFVSCEYDELIEENKKQWKKRKDFINTFIQKDIPLWSDDFETDE